MDVAVALQADAAHARLLHADWVVTRSVDPDARGSIRGFLRAVYTQICQLVGVKQTSRMKDIMSAFDPNVWSGRALQVDFAE
jgi:hypothetical protein